MKKILLLSLSVLLLFSFTACGDEGTSETSQATEQVSSLDPTTEAKKIISEYQLQGGTLYSSNSQTPGEFLDEDLIRGFYGDAITMPDFSCVESYAVYIDETKPILPCEFGIFEIADEAKAEEFMVFLQARINKKIQNSIAYPSMDTTMLKSAIFEIRDGYLWYIAVKDSNSKIDNTLKDMLK